ncbi:hypothetical protein E2C01_013594 [Portunus trituberculatus]|uniref:Uncharacterized protein n=1 Tax=Portunus trituberculatus TaxID=210409 RepID=A0A5B7DGP5_PORTR|nr:hypothetical protein [Portunus trituberculatus]
MACVIVPKSTRISCHYNSLHHTEKHHKKTFHEGRNTRVSHKAATTLATWHHLANMLHLTSKATHN